MPKIDIDAIPVIERTGYPAPYDQAVKGRLRQALGEAGGLSQFGVNLTRLKPGAASALRHWHQREDELVFIVEGEATLCEDDGETILRAGEAAAFRAGAPNGHCLVNRSDADVVLLEIGTRCEDDLSTYPDQDVDLQMVKKAGSWSAHRKNGERY